MKSNHSISIPSILQPYILFHRKTMTPLRSIFYSVFVISGTALGAVNGPCSIDGTPGVCISTSSCSGSDGSFRSGFCPNDPSNIKCCIKPECGSGGNCRFSSQCSGSTKTGLCPGPADFQCCLGKSSGGGDTSTSHSLSAHGVTFIEGFEGWNPNFYEDSAVSNALQVNEIFYFAKTWF